MNITQEADLIRPKWTDAKEYEFLKNMDGDQFAWEFLRRNIKYRKDYSRYKKFWTIDKLYLNKNKKKVLFKYFKCDPPAKEDESYNQYIERINKKGLYRLKGGTCSIREKRQEFYIMHDLKEYKDMAMYDPNRNESPGFYKIELEYPAVLSPWFSGNKEVSTDINEGDVVIKFSAFQDIDKQLGKAKEQLKLKQIELLKKSKNYPSLSAADKNRYIIYIRILDAIQTNATESEIMFYIYNSDFPNNDETYPITINNIENGKEAFGEHVMKRIKSKLKNHKEEATKYRDIDYLSIVKSLKFYQDID
jgi:hypothetical protein